MDSKISIGKVFWTLLLTAMVWGTAVACTNHLRAQAPDTYLPLVAAPPGTPTPTPTATPTATPTPTRPPLPHLNNPSFEEGWTDLPPLPWGLINQQPNQWQLSWLDEGEPLYDDPNNVAGGVPECIHKLWWQLPPDEQPGGENALILDGDTTYKMFHSGEPFGSELRQTLTGLVPGSSWHLMVPVQVHLYGDVDPYSAESGVWVNGAGGWANAGMMGDRTWYEHDVPFTVPANGQIEIVIRVKSKWATGKSFFIDALRVEP